MNRAAPRFVSLRGGLLNLRTYIEQNRGSIANYGARYREGKRIASTAAEASVNNLSQGEWSRSSKCVGRKEEQTCFFRFASPLPMAILQNVSPISRPFAGSTIISPFVPVPLFQRAA